MAKNCIICPRRNGSGEHTFPAALGGRRINRGIYCGHHNNKLGGHAGLLAEQLRAINAWLGVRPDRSDGPTEFVTENPIDGQSYVIAGTKVELAAPHLLKETEMPDGKRQIQVAFPSQQEFQRWLAEQRKAGVDLKVDGRGVWGNAFFSQPYAVRLTLGGPEGLRAVGYVALTFLAHHFPDVARQRHLKPFRDYVLGVTNDPLVWWDFDPPSPDLPAQRFRFGHRIVISLSAARQEAYARVSFFSTLSFAMPLGSARVDQDRTYLVDIDPLADHPPHDIHETESPLLAPVTVPTSLTAGLQKEIQEGKAEERFKVLLGNIFSWLLDEAARELLPQINAARSLNAPMRQQRVREVLRSQEQRVFNLISYVVNGLKAQFLAKETTAGIAASLDMLIASDPSSPTGINQVAICTLELGMGALTAEICRRLDVGDMDAPQLRSLLGEGPGAAIAGRAAVQPWAMHHGFTL